MSEKPKGSDVPVGLRIFLHLDGAAVLIATLYAYARLDGKWWFFAALLFVPDLFMLGYLRNSRIGARIYNYGHTYLTPVMLAAIGLLVGSPVIAQVGIIWIAHIALDRVFGYGFKYASEFKSTHYERV
jgi:hypothetical protein